MNKKLDEMIKSKIENMEKKYGKKLTEKEIERIKKSVTKKYDREKFLRRVFVTLTGVLALGAGSAILVKENNNNKNTTEIESEGLEETEHKWKERIKFNRDMNKIILEENNQTEYDRVIAEILNEYNEKYDTELSQEDITYIKSIPQFLLIGSDGTYIQNYKVSSSENDYISDDIQDIYIMINNNNNSIISSLGQVKGEITNVDTKVVMTYGRKEYFESDKKIDLTENKTYEEIKEIYDTLKNEYEKGLEQDR